MSEQVVGALHQDTFLGPPLGTVPPRSDKPGKKDSKEQGVQEDDILSVSVGDDKLGEGNAHAEALLAVGVAVLDVVVAHLLVREGLVGLGKFDIVIVERLGGLVLGRVGANLVGVVLEGQALVVRLDLLLVEGLGRVSGLLWLSISGQLTSEIPRIS